VVAEDFEREHAGVDEQPLAVRAVDGARFERAVLADGTPVVLKHVRREPRPGDPHAGASRPRLVDHTCSHGARNVVTRASSG
jgi:hypothetical protein